MRTFTQKDKSGLVVAMRVFLRYVNGERLSRPAGLPLIEKALQNGVYADTLLNSVNWTRAQAIDKDLTFEKYVNILIEKKIDARPIKDENLWHEPLNGFNLIAEAAHDFYVEVTEKGGRWNVPSALTNLAKCIQKYDLQTILSEELIHQVNEKSGDEKNYFNYILFIVKDFNSLVIEKPEIGEKEPTKAAIEAENAERAAEAAEAEEKEDFTVDPVEDEPFPEPEELGDVYADQDMPGFESVVLTQRNPNDIKKDCLRVALGNYTPNELMGIINTIEKGMDLTLDQILDKLALGQFDVKKETPDAREIHQSINGELQVSFIDCVRIQGKEMDENTASEYDLLHESWDLRTPETRKLHKLLKLILTEGKDDPDLLSAVEDIEQLYAESNSEID